MHTGGPASPLLAEHLPGLRQAWKEMHCATIRCVAARSWWQFGRPLVGKWISQMQWMPTLEYSPRSETWPDRNTTAGGGKSEKQSKMLLR